VTENDGGFGCHLKARTTARLNRKNVSVVARGIGGRRETEGRARSSQYPAYFTVDGRTCCSTPTGNLHGLAASFQRERRGTREEE
jgi:hypothetical protein